jgi:hypothetical protein
VPFERDLEALYRPARLAEHGGATAQSAEADMRALIFERNGEPNAMLTLPELSQAMFSCELCHGRGALSPQSKYQRLFLHYAFDTWMARNYSHFRSSATRTMPPAAVMEAHLSRARLAKSLSPSLRRRVLPAEAVLVPLGSQPT